MPKQAKQVTLTISLKSLEQRMAIFERAAKEGFTSVSAWLQSIADSEMPQPSPVAYYVEIAITGSRSTCAKCDGGTDYVPIHEDGTISPAICTNCLPS